MVFFIAHCVQVRFAAAVMFCQYCCLDCVFVCACVGEEDCVCVCGCVCVCKGFCVGGG